LTLQHVYRMYYTLKMKLTRIFPLRLSEDHDHVVAAIKAKTGTTSDADVWRQALRLYADKLKIKWPKAGKTD
jgi:succinyl-CoA synthetase beta subunit